MYAKKSLGQNFLISPRVVSAIASAGDLKAGDIILEVGPGKGVLTKALLSSGAIVKAVEKDDRLIPALKEAFKKEIDEGRLELIHGDILEIDASDLKLETPFKLIANIPYYITGALIRKFLSSENKPALCILMVQKEVAQRIIGRDGKESLLSISVKAFAEPSLVMNVSRGNFFPEPSVDSAVIRLSNIKNPFESPQSERRFFEIARAGFSQKRKKLISNLEKTSGKGRLKDAFKELDINENTRAEDLALDKWLLLSKAIY